MEIRNENNKKVSTFGRNGLDYSAAVIEDIKNEKDLTLIAIAGKNIKENKNSLKKLFLILEKLDVNIEMLSAGASESAYYFLIKKEEFKRSINKIHDELVTLKL